MQSAVSLDKYITLNKKKEKLDVNCEPTQCVFDEHDKVADSNKQIASENVIT